MHEIFLAIVFLSLGSFSSVLIYRLPLMETGTKDINLFYPRSHCPSCKQTIPIMNLLPIIGFLLNYGRCSLCNCKISFNYPINELIHLFVGLGIFYLHGISITLLFSYLIFTILYILFILDLKYLYLPLSLNILFVFIGLTSNIFFELFISYQSLYFNIDPITYSLSGFIIGFSSLWTINAIYKILKQKDGIGGGDFILFGGIGAVIGPFLLPLVLLLGSLSSLFLYVIFNKAMPSDKIPLGAGIIFGFFLYVSLNFFELFNNFSVL